jgi:hypothetical protein
MFEVFLLPYVSGYSETIHSGTGDLKTYGKYRPVISLKVDATVFLHAMLSYRDMYKM